MGPSLFDVLKYVDQGKVYDFVHMALAKGKCLGVRHGMRHGMRHAARTNRCDVYGV